ncbi:RNase H domain-containing protein [Trichonephila clavipes]|nr:RNase H domain-containing protein [Trichonephila clavipes]
MELLSEAFCNQNNERATKRKDAAVRKVADGWTRKATASDELEPDIGQHFFVAAYGNRKTVPVYVDRWDLMNVRRSPKNVLVVHRSIAIHLRPTRVYRNDIADRLAIESSHKDSTFGGCLTFSEIATRFKQDISSSWKQTPVDEWYEGNCPGAALLGTSIRSDETTHAWFRNGHTRAQRHVAGLKFTLPVQIAL